MAAACGSVGLAARAVRAHSAARLIWLPHHPFNVCSRADIHQQPPGWLCAGAAAGGPAQGWVGGWRWVGARGAAFAAHAELQCCCLWLRRLPGCAAAQAVYRALALGAGVEGARTAASNRRSAHSRPCRRAQGGAGGGQDGAGVLVPQPDLRHRGPVRVGPTVGCVAACCTVWFWCVCCSAPVAAPPSRPRPAGRPPRAHTARASSAPSSRRTSA